MMRRGAATLALALCCFETSGMSMKKQPYKRTAVGTPADASTAPGAVQGGHAKPLLILRLAHSGSSWFTEMLSEQNDTFIAREGIYKFGGEEEKLVRQMSVDEITDYVLKTLSMPMGSIAKPDKYMTYTYACLNDTKSEPEASRPSQTSLISHGQHAHTVNPAVTQCVQKLRAACPLKFVGATLDPIGTGLDVHGDEVWRRVAKAYPDLPVIVYRRTNLVKHAIAGGGICGRDMNQLHQQKDVDEFMKGVMAAVEHDKALRKAALHFKNRMYVTYEDLQNKPYQVMNKVLEFLEMPGKMKAELVERGVQETPDDLRQLFSNFAELDSALSQRSPCLAEQLRAATPKVFHKPCGDV